MLSVTPTAGSPEKKRSMIWAIMSVTPAAVWYGGKVKVSSGSRKAMAGRMSSLVHPLLRPSASLLMTQELDASEPEAGMVTTAASGRQCSTVAFLAQKSHGAPS